MANKTPQRAIDLLRECVTHYDKEDRAIRERQIRMWRKLKLFWEGFHRTWYSEVAHDWRIWDDDVDTDDTDQAYYDKPVNVFRAYLESIIAALSVTVPPIKCYPDDAENELDILTARAGDRSAKLIYRHNDVQLLWLHSLFIYCTEGMLAFYCYAREDKSYGTYEKKEYEDVEETHSYTRCPECGYDMEESQDNPDEQISPEVQALLDVKIDDQKNKFQPDDSDVEIQDVIQNTDMCPACMAQIAPMLVKETLVIPRLIGVTTEPKSRICIEVYGGLYVKVPNYARTQEDCPYLALNRESNYVKMIEKYADMDGDSLKKKLAAKLKASHGVFDPYEEWGRLSPQYNGEYPENVVTERQWWLRPMAFNILDKADNDYLRKLYPNGAKAVFINDEFAHACNESLDDCWTVAYNPIADYIHYDPLGLLLVSVQEITNDIISLTLQTIEHGIPQTFADSGVLNFPAYRQLEATPGGVYEATPKSGKTVRDAFHEVKTATLSQEVMPFAANIQSLGQVVSGAIPSIFGGQLQNAGTASEYSMSRAQALQRLQNTWKMLTIAWKNMNGKAIPLFLKQIQEDERSVEKTKDGNFFNVYIRKAETEGKIGRIELEANENLPITWSQRKDVVMQLLQAGNPEILEILGAPKNLPIIREMIGLDDLTIPGEDDVEKQFEEIKQLLNSEPFQDPTTGEELPSVDVDPEMDEHEIEFDVCRSWVVSEIGRQTKLDNEAGFRNVLLHAKMHMAIIQQRAQLQAMAQAESGAAPPEKPKKNTKTPIQGESDVQTA